MRRQFLFSKEREGTEEIWLRSIEEGWERPIANAAMFASGITRRVTEPAFSPDGRRLAFLREQAGPASTYVAAIAGGPPVLVTAGIYPTWSPDGNWIAVRRITRDSIRLVKARVGGDPEGTAIGPPGGRNFRPQWSPAGDWIAWSAVKGNPRPRAA